LNPNNRIDTQDTTPVESCPILFRAAAWWSFSSLSNSGHKLFLLTSIDLRSLQPTAGVNSKYLRMRHFDQNGFVFFEWQALIPKYPGRSSSTWSGLCLFECGFRPRPHKMGLFFRVRVAARVGPKWVCFFERPDTAQAAFPHATTESWYHGWRYGISRPAASLTIGLTGAESTLNVTSR
jgi:hypothetical protein